MTLAAPLFLLGLLALLAPWLLHRLNERSAPVQDFPSERFLEPARSVRARRKRLRYLGLLALRLLALALLCLLFAEPLLKRWNPLAGEERQLHMLVLDQTFSMRASQRWSAAQQQVSEILATLPAASTMQLVGVDGSAATVVEPTTDRTAIEQGARSLQPGYSTLDYVTLMRQLNTLAERQPLPVRVHLVTDAQANAMPQRLNDLRADGLRALQVWPVGEEFQANTRVSAEVVPVDAERFDLEVSVQRFGEINSTVEQRVLLEAPGEETRELTVPPTGGRSTLTFASLNWPSLDRVVRYTLTLSPGDEFAEDDRVVIPVRRVLPSKVVIVREPDADPATRSSDAQLYLQTAIDLDSELAIESPASGNESAIANADILIVLDQRPLTGAELPPLTARGERHLQNGGILLHVINNTVPESGVSRINSATTNVEFVDESHPLTLNAKAWRDVQFYVHQPLAAQENADVLLATDNGNPVLLESRRPSGHLLWLNAALNGSDNNLPISPVFVPFLHKLAHYYLFQDRYPSQLVVGENVKLGASVQLLDPSGHSLLKLSESVGGSTHAVSQPGIYTILDQLGEHPVLVTADIRESDTVSASATALAAWESVVAAITDGTATDTTGNSGESGNTGAQNGSDSATALSAEQSSPDLASVARWLLPLCLIVFLAEALFANHHLRVRRA